MAGALGAALLTAGLVYNNHKMFGAKGSETEVESESPKKSDKKKIESCILAID